MSRRKRWGLVIAVAAGLAFLLAQPWGAAWLGRTVEVAGVSAVAILTGLLIRDA